MKFGLYACLFAFVSFFFSCCSTNIDNPEEWPEYLGGPERNHYSTLKQINVDNVDQLKVA